MQSTNLLPALRELPTDETQGRQDARSMIRRLVETDASMKAAEFAAGASFGLWSIFDQVNVDDAVLAKATAAYESAYPGLAADHTLYEQAQEMIGRGPDSMDGFLNGLKGKMAEFDAKEMLESQGFTSVSLAENPIQGVWDISAIGPDGQEVLIQVKAHVAGSASQVMDAMDANPDVLFALSDELHNQILSMAPEYADQIIGNIGSVDALTASAKDNLGILADNMGIDIPDGVGDLLPYAGAIMASGRLIYSVLKTEKQFKAVDRTTKNKLQVVQTLTLMSRIGVSTVMGVVGGKAGVLAGSVVPFFGNIIGGIGGAVAGAGMGMYLNKHLQPHMLDLALDITDLTRDDLFYYKNMALINRTACSLQQTNKELQRQKPLPALLAAPA